MDLANKRILITGGYGLAGEATYNHLASKGCNNIKRFHKSEYNLTKEEAVQDLFSDYKPNIVFHFAAAVGGIQANKSKPASLCYSNLLMNTFILEVCAKARVKKLCLTGSGCVYPQNAPLPLVETSLWDGIPEPITALYGLTKRLLVPQAEAYRRQYGLNSFVILPANLFGAKDSFHPEYSHVIPGIIQKIHHATKYNKPSVELWGTGEQVRDFLYINDFAKIVVALMEDYVSQKPVNLGTGIGVSIQTVAKIIKKHLKFKGEIKWNSSKLAGQQQRIFDISWLKETIGEYDFYPLDKGIKETIEWYKIHCQTARYNTIGD